MADEWMTAILADVCKSVDYGYTASAVQDATAGPKFLRITDIRQGGLRWDDVPHVEIPPDKIERYLLHPGDIVVARTGAFTGANAYIVPPVPTVFASYLVRITAGPHLDSRFAYYFMQSAAYRTHLAGVLGGSAQPNASAKALTRVQMPLPPLAEQRRISEALGALDDKIELNRRMNETLEAVAQVMFTSRFIEFDGCDDIVDTPAGALPRSWSTMLLGDILTERSDRVGDREVPLYSSTNSGLEPRANRYTKSLSATVDKNKLIERGDLVFGLSRQVLNYGFMKDEVGSVSPAYRVYKVNASVFQPRLLERLMRHQAAYFYQLVAASSREGQSVSPGSVANLPVGVPPTGMQQEYLDIVAPIEQRQALSELESHALASIRDALLPKLIYGELRIPDAERLVSEVT